ncbi:MAG: GNAT family N-acyltransferase [Alphaproteobacteria bacterium]
MLQLQKNIFQGPIGQSIAPEIPSDQKNTYAISSDMSSHVIKRYFTLRENSYKKEGANKLRGLLGQGKIDHHDLVSSFVIAQNENDIIGGARLTIHEKGSEMRLPLEGSDFSLVDAFPELNLKEKSYAEPGRFIIKKEFRSGENYSLHHTSISKLCILHTIESGCDYLFAVAPATQARLYQLTYRRYGIDTTVCDHIQLPEKPTDEGRKMILLMIDLKNVKKENIFLKNS